MVKYLLLTSLTSSLKNYSSYLGITLAGIIFFTLLIILLVTLYQLFLSKNDKEISISRNEFLLTNMFKHKAKEIKNIRPTKRQNTYQKYKRLNDKESF